MGNRSTRINGFNGPPFRRLTGADIPPAFDQEAKNLILAAMDIGCMGRISSKGHCILHNNADGTASVPPKLAQQNRTSQNTRANVRRLMNGHHAERPSSNSTPEPRPAQEITVAQAFLQHSTAFTVWFDAQGGSLPADTPLRVTFGESGQPLFEVVRTAGTAAEAASTLQEREPGCGARRRPFSTAAAADPRRRVHRDRAASVPTTTTDSDITPGTPQKAKYDMPAPTHRTAPAGTAEQPDDPMAVLQNVREALGPDPRVTQLEARVAGLETEAARQKQRADEAHARLALIREALHA
ncbi:hypothetical protein ACFU99_01495 [Streptomyces sp. NPDC057654]|uniref:hypothetical protein n=1 Tax=Streptomyces sp. NPDC057654 TaxID=3346196 RepID=UPI003695E451